VSSVVDDCRRELQDRQAAEGQHTWPGEGCPDTGGGSGFSGVTDSAAGTEVVTAAADDITAGQHTLLEGRQDTGGTSASRGTEHESVMDLGGAALKNAVGADASPCSCSTGGCDSDAVAGADADTMMAGTEYLVGQGSGAAQAVAAAASGDTVGLVSAQQSHALMAERLLAAVFRGSVQAAADGEHAGEGSAGAHAVAAGRSGDRSVSVQGGANDADASAVMAERLLAAVFRGSAPAATHGAWQSSAGADSVAAAQLGAGFAVRIQQDPADTVERTGSHSFRASGALQHVQHAMQNMDSSQISAAAGAAAAPAGPAVPAAPRGRPRTYTAEEQAVMCELNLSSLAYIELRRRQSGLSWRVLLRAEGLSRTQSELNASCRPVLALLDSCS
jgi:hypothetical protein